MLGVLNRGLFGRFYVLMKYYVFFSFLFGGSGGLYLWSCEYRPSQGVFFLGFGPR